MLNERRSYKIGSYINVAVKLLNQALGDPEAPVGEDASPDEEDEFHRKLDKLVPLQLRVICQLFTI